MVKGYSVSFESNENVLKLIRRGRGRRGGRGS